jgi:hypothetical protein
VVSLASPVKPTRNVPEIVPVVVRQLARMFLAQEIPRELFEQKIRRICVEELNPRALMLLVRELPSGGIRFIIKDSATHSFLQMVECRLRKIRRK